MPNDDGLGVDERVDLEGLYSDHEPPPELEAAVVRRLVETGWIDGTGRPWVAWSTRLAAGLILFAAGWGVGIQRAEPTDADRTNYMLLLWEGEEFGAGLPEGSFADEYSEWAVSVAGLGVSLSGSELGSSREMIGLAEAAPRSNRDDELGGYFLIGAANMAAARRIAEGHPHLRHGGWIEVAPIVSR